MRSEFLITMDGNYSGEPDDNEDTPFFETIDHTVSGHSSNASTEI